MRERVSVVGAGLAGCEAAYQLAQRGIEVDLYEMKPLGIRTPAHHSDDFAELVCSNSLRSDRLENAVGLLKEEMRLLDSLIMRAADATRVPAGGALAVDRVGFAQYVTRAIREHPFIHVTAQQIERIPEPPVIVATGPLTYGALNDEIAAVTGAGLHFFDAAAPLVLTESLDHSVVFRASRYERGDDYLNCPMSQVEYERFYEALITAQTVPLKEFENTRVFEGCMPVEVMAKRGPRTLLFGPLKPVGFQHVLQRMGRERPFAIVQLRQDNAENTVYNLVGFQTNLTFPEQRRVFRMIPGLEQAEFVRYGVMHRNTFLSSPGLLGWDYQMKTKPGVYFAGQITGVEGYVESASSGLMAGIQLALMRKGRPPLDFSAKTAIGALGHYIAEYAGADFQPMNVNYGIIESLPHAPKNKRERYGAVAQRALKIVSEMKTIC